MKSIKICCLLICCAIALLVTSCNTCDKGDYVNRITDRIAEINIGDSLIIKNNSGKVVIGICDKKEITYPVTGGFKPKEYCSTSLVKQETANWHFNYGLEPIDDKLTRYEFDNKSGVGCYFGVNSQPSNIYNNVSFVELITHWGQKFKNCGRAEVKNSVPLMVVYYDRSQTKGIGLLRYQYLNSNNDTITWDIKK